MNIVYKAHALKKGAINYQSYSILTEKPNTKYKLCESSGVMTAC